MALIFVRDEQPDDHEGRRDQACSGTAARTGCCRGRPRSRGGAAAPAGSCGMFGSRKKVSRMIRTAPKRSAAWIRPEERRRGSRRRTAPSGTAAAACSSSGPPARARSRRPRTRSRTRSCSCTAAGTASSGRPGTSPAARARFAANRNENSTDRMPMSRRIVPWANPRTKNAMKYRTMSRSTVPIPPMNSPRFTHLPP